MPAAVILGLTRLILIGLVVFTLFSGVVLQGREPASNPLVHNLQVDLTAPPSQTFGESTALLAPPRWEGRRKGVS